MIAPVAQYSSEYLAEDTGPTVIATASMMIILCTVFVGLRYYARYLTSAEFGAEDMLIPFAWLAEVGLCVVGIVMVEKVGTGRHAAYILQTDPAKLTQHLKGIVINEFLHPSAVAFPKLCVLILYLRVFTQKIERGIAWGLMGFIFAAWLSFIVATCFQCTPFAYTWDKTISGGHCFDNMAFAYSSSVPNIVTDLVVAFLPIRTVLGLKISTGRKIGLMLIFLTGSVGIVASIVRTVVFARTDFLLDITYSNVPLLVWTILEPGLYLLAACAISFKPLFRIAARQLHLSAVISHTKSTLNKSHHNTSRTQHKEIHMETLKSVSSGGFTKLSGGKDASYEDHGSNDSEEVWSKKNGNEEGLSDGSLNFVVTRTIEIRSEDVEDVEDSSSGKAGKQVHYDANVGWPL